MKIITPNVAHWTFDTLFPRYCVGCGASDHAICDNCRKLVVEVKQQQCLKCRKISKQGATCAKCRPVVPIKHTLVALQYGDGPVREALHWLKYHGRRDVLDVMSPYLLKNTDLDNTLSQLSVNETLIVPVPLHQKRLWWRGFNQSLIIARSLSRKYDISISTALIRRDFKQAQSGLRKLERAHNVDRSFAAPKPHLIKDKTIILVDDIVTTGATLTACAWALKKAGASVVVAAVLAQAQ